MFLRAAALTTFMVGLSLASAGTTLAQFLPPLPLPGAVAGSDAAGAAGRGR